MENPIKMDDLGVPLFLETPISKDDEHPFPMATHEFIGISWLMEVDQVLPKMARCRGNGRHAAAFLSMILHVT